jgi:hypothetical protein
MSRTEELDLELTRLQFENARLKDRISGLEKTVARRKSLSILWAALAGFIGTAASLFLAHFIWHLRP